MPNLYVFDKDGTLVHPRKDGYVDSPEDQVLYEGVRDKLDRLRSEGHVLAIASNQGGCDWYKVPAESLNVGDQFKGKHPFDDDEVQVVEGIERLGLKRFEISAGGFVHSYWNDLSKVFIQHKTIDRTLNTNQEKTSAYHFCP